MGLVWGAVRFGLTTLWLGCVITMMGLWWYNKFQHTQQSKVEISNGSKSTDKGSDSCSTKNIDIFIVTERRSFPLVEWTVRSIELFMPCRGRMHIVCEPGETTMLLGFVGRVKDLSIHEMERPKSLMNASAYHMMQWPQFWADKYVSPTADYVMFMDSDSIMSLPVTCRSLFAPNGKIFLPAWKDWSTQFLPLCTEALGKECKHIYMNYYPFLFPVRYFGPLREHMVRSRQVTNFNEVILVWDRMAPSRPFDHGYQVVLSQFVIMGNFLEFFHPHVVEVVACYHASKWEKNRQVVCNDYVHSGVHYAWRPCRHVGGCIVNEWSLFKGDGVVYSNKFSILLMNHLSEIIQQGLCFMQSLNPSSRLFPEGKGYCTPPMIGNIHPEALTYQTLPVNMTIQQLKFAPDPFQHLCPSVELRTPESRDYEEKDDMMA